MKFIVFFIDIDGDIFDVLKRKRESMIVKEINHEIMKIFLIDTLLFCNFQILVINFYTLTYFSFKQ